MMRIGCWIGPFCFVLFRKVGSDACLSFALSCVPIFKVGVYTIRRTEVGSSKLIVNG